MSPRGPVALDRALWQEFVAVLDEAAAGGARRALARLAAREGLAADEAQRELAAFPAHDCVARERGAGVRAAACTFGSGCPVAEECPLVRGGSSASIAASALGQLVLAFAERCTRPLAPAPIARLAELPPLLDELLQRSGRLGADAPPRARTSLTVLDLALRRGGPFGATGPYLSGAELEQLAAFLPPGSGRDDARLGPIEAFVRRAACAEVALVDLRPRG